MKSESAISSNLLSGSFHQGNYLWAIGMNLAWNDLMDNHLGKSLQLMDSDPLGQELFDKFSAQNFINSLLSSEDYYARSGWGNACLEMIKQEMQAKFPGGPLALLDGLTIQENDLISFAYLYKAFTHLGSFEETEMYFKQEKVLGFTLKKGSTAGVEIITYRDESNFVLRLASENERDEIFLIKGFEASTIDDLLENLKNISPKESFEQIKEMDELQIPNISLKHSRTYSELIGKTVLSPKSRSLQITEMKELINFSLNYQGAMVENEALIVMSRSLPMPKRLILNEPFWLIMKEAAKPLAYLALRVENTNVLELVD